jgi:cytochrome c oxidase subunit I+III
MATLVTLVLTVASILVWLWRGTSFIPEKPKKDVGLGLVLPLYASGPASVSWWAMFITMTGDATAFFSLVFGYFFFFTIHGDFPPPGVDGPGLLWPAVSIGLFVLAWGAARLALAWNRDGRVLSARLCMGVGGLVSLGAAGALLWAPHTTGLEPTVHVYPAIVWTLCIWTALHAAVGSLMLFYCLARSLRGLLTPEHDIDIHNVALYWHFMGVTALVTVATIALFPLASGGA